MPFRRKADPIERPAGVSDSSKKIRVVGAVELSPDGHPRRIRLEQISDRSSKTLHGFVGRMVEPGAHVIAGLFDDLEDACSASDGMTVCAGLAALLARLHNEQHGNEGCYE
jgi:hypothetical protein